RRRQPRSPTAGLLVGGNLVFEHGAEFGFERLHPGGVAGLPCGSDAEVIEPFVPGAGAEAGAGGGLDRSEVVALERMRRRFDGDVDDAALEIGDVTLVHRPRRVKELEGPTLHELERVEKLPSVDEGVE